MKFAFIAAEKADQRSRVGVGRSACRGRATTRGAHDPNRAAHARIGVSAVVVREAHERSRRTYGSPRIHAELAAREEHVGRNRIIRLMQQEGLGRACVDGTARRR